MDESIKKQFLEAFAQIPAILRYPAMLYILGSLYQELPKAEKEYEAAKWETLDKLIEIFERKAD